jgi:CHAT domain-containing protein
VEGRVIIHPGQGLRQHRFRVWLIALFAVLAVGVTAAFHHYRRTASDARLAKLADIVGAHRLTRARLSSGFAFAPCQVDSSADRLVRGLVCEGPPPTSWTAASDLREFAGSMRSGDQNESPDSHGMGIWQLVMGHADDAVADLRAAARREPKNARVLNDLAVGLTEVAQVHDDPSALIDAYVAADSAVRLDASLPEAQFTLAVLLEQLYLRTDAVAAWTRYLELDGKSPWAAEARASLAMLRPREDQWGKTRERLLNAVSKTDKSTVDSIVGMYPSETRALIQDKLGEWGAVVVAGDSAKARMLLDLSRALAEPLRVATSDPFMVDAVAAIDRAKSRGDRARIRALAEGHVALAYGTGPSGSRNPPEAATRLATARKLLAFGASPMSGWASLFEGRVQIVRLKPADALATLMSIRAATPARYLVLRGSAAQYVGLVYDTRSDYVHSVAAYDSSLAESRTTGEPLITLRVGSWLSQAATVLRGREAGWRALYAALAATPRYASNDRAVSSVVNFAASATGNDAPRLSLRYCNELIQIAHHLGDPALTPVAFKCRAEQRAKFGETALARADIDSAIAAAQQIKDTTSRTRTIGDVTLASARIAVRSSPAQAEPALRRVVDLYNSTHYDRGLGTAYLYLAQSRVALGKLESARAAFDSATDVMQRSRATITNAAERATFLDDARATIDQIVAFHASHNAKEAFEYFEQTRSRVLLERLSAGRGPSDSSKAVLEELQRSLSDTDVVLSYAVLPRETLIWTIGRNRFELHHVAVTSSEIEDLVTRLQQSVREPSGVSETAASYRLYDLLVQTAGHVDREKNLTVLPDRWLHYVPFGALRDAATGRFLVQDHSVTYAPSATLLAAGLREPHPSFSHSSKVLAIGDPKFDSRVFELPDLPAAKREAETIAGFYDHQKPVIGVDATDTALEKSAPSFDILHFAGHAIVGRNAPQLSHLVLASDGHSDGAVFASEIAQWKLPRTRLAILSGCSTGDGKLSATEGASSLARAFFSAGVPAVLSSLWAIDDNETADFFIAFHRRLVQGHPAAVALRETQLEWLGNAKSRAHPVSSWAAFQLFGG